MRLYELVARLSWIDHFNYDIIDYVNRRHDNTFIERSSDDPFSMMYDPDYHTFKQGFLTAYNLSEFVYMPLSKLSKNCMYVVKARNISIAKWDGDSFVGVREKMKSKFLDREYHYDSCSTYGTAKPIMCLSNKKIDLDDNELLEFITKIPTMLEFE